MKRQHPIAIMQYMSKNFWLLIIPVIRGFATPGFDFYLWLKGAYIDIAVLLFILGSAFLRWWFVKYEFRDDCLSYRGGLFLKQKFEMPYSTISAISTKRIFWLRPTKAVSIYIDSETQSAVNKPNDTDVFIISDVKMLNTIFDKVPDKSETVKLKYEASKWNLLLFSFVFSSTLSGIVFIGTFFVEGSKVVGKQLEDRFLTAVTDITTIAEKVIAGVTPIAVGVSLVLLGGWLISFLSNLIRHINFCIQREGECIYIQNGFFSKWHYFINADKINYTDVRQNLLMKIFRVMSVHVSCSGYGKAKNEIPVFVPVTTRKRVIGSMQMLLPNFKMQKVRYKSNPKYIFRFIGAPAIMILVELLAGYIAAYFLPTWYNVIVFVILMVEIFTCYMLIVKIVSFSTNGIEYKDKTVTLEYNRYFQFHNVIIPETRIAMVKINQTIFQQRNKSCDIIIFTKAEFTKSHRVKGIPIADAEKLIRDMKY